MGLEHYDYLIVGAGLYGLTCARILTNKGFKCLVIDKRDRVGGNCSTRNYNGIEIHEHGAHVFHTSDEEVWSFINRYSRIRQYELKVCSTDGKNVYALPFNMFTFSSLNGKIRPEDAWDMTQGHGKGNTLEEVAINSVGKETYEKLIKGYTEKQWGKPCSEIPGDIIRRLPVRYTYDNRYFDDKYQGLPEDGYEKLFKHITMGIGFDGKNIEAHLDILLNTDFLKDKDEWINKADNIIYCGPVDELLDYELGELSWRSLRFENSEYEYNGHNGQGCPLMNNSDPSAGYTRTIDHVYFGDFNSHRGKTILTYEYPEKWKKGMERYYPDGSNTLYSQYTELLAKKYPNIHLGGRLGLYRYMDMDDTIREAMNYCSDKKKTLRDWEHYNEISDFCKIWVVGTRKGDVNINKDYLYYNSFITNDNPSRQNINKLNKFLSEFVAMWYVWKNHLYSKYVAFCHYRRMIDMRDIKFYGIHGKIQHFNLNKFSKELCDKTFDRTSDYQFISRGCLFPGPSMIKEDVLDYFRQQTVIPDEKVRNYCNPNKGEGMNYYNREIYCCEWETFCNLMEFVNGYVEFIARKYNLSTYEDWKKHISRHIISYYKNLGPEYVNGKKDYSLGLLFQKKENYLNIFNIDEGLGSPCNNWRAYSYILEDLISIYIGSNDHISSDKLGN